jgi:fatty acid desaturase
MSPGPVPLGEIDIEVVDTDETLAVTDITYNPRGLYRKELANAREQGWTKPNPVRSVTRSAFIIGGLVLLEVVAQLVGGWLIRIPVLFLQVAFLTGVMSAMHEAGHGHLFASRRPNFVALYFFSGVLLLNGAWYIEEHRWHHTYTRYEPGEPPVNNVGVFNQFKMFFSVGTAVFYQWSVKISLMSLVGRYPSYILPRRRKQVRRGAVFTIFVWIAAIGGAWMYPVLLTGWLLPWAVLVCFGWSIVVLPQHARLGYRADPLFSSRHVVCPRWYEFINWDNNYHSAHHLMPAVTWDNLRKFAQTLPEGERAGIIGYHIDEFKAQYRKQVPEHPESDPLPTTIPPPMAVVNTRSRDN